LNISLEEDLNSYNANELAKSHSNDILESLKENVKHIFFHLITQSYRSYASKEDYIKSAKVKSSDTSNQEESLDLDSFENEANVTENISQKINW